MGVINVTPDSLWEGSRCATPEEAAERARQLEAQGADVIDVGGCSTRPGALPVDEEEEYRRVLPALRAVRAAVRCPISVDTFRARIAREAVAAGADLINDVRGLQGDPAMGQALAELGVPAILMDDSPLAPHEDGVAGVAARLQAILGRAKAAGMPLDRVVLDPGFGFGKSVRQNLALVARLGELRRLGRPLCIGVSRKGTIGAALGGLPVKDRLAGTAALVALAVQQGASIVRVHDVREMVHVVRVAEAALRAAGLSQADRVRIEGLRFEGVHGVHGHERRAPQPFVVDVELEADLHRAGGSDDLRDTIDYGEVAEVVRSVVEGPQRNLLEALAEEVAARCLERFAVATVRVRIHKPRAPVGHPFRDVSVEVVRGRPWHGRLATGPSGA